MDRSDFANAHYLLHTQSTVSFATHVAVLAALCSIALQLNLDTRAYSIACERGIIFG